MLDSVAVELALSVWAYRTPIEVRWGYTHNEDEENSCVSLIV